MRLFRSQSSAAVSMSAAVFRLMFGSASALSSADVCCFMSLFDLLLAVADDDDEEFPIVLYLGAPRSLAAKGWA